MYTILVLFAAGSLSSADLYLWRIVATMVKNTYHQYINLQRAIDDGIQLITSSINIKVALEVI